MSAPGTQGILRGRQPRSAFDPKRTSYEVCQTPLDRQVGQGNFKIYDEPVSLPAPFELAAKLIDPPAIGLHLEEWIGSFASEIIIRAGSYSPCNLLCNLFWERTTDYRAKPLIYLVEPGGLEAR